MASHKVSEHRLQEILSKLGPPPLDDVDDYLNRLYAETRIDDSFQEYLDWIDSEDTEDDLYQTPRHWLKQLCDIHFSDLPAVTNIRSSLSFKEIDYMVLSAAKQGNSMYLVTSEPSALMLEPLESSSLSTAKQTRMHPALISLSVSPLDESGSEFQDIPGLVLPVGRLLHGARNGLLRDIQYNISRDMILKNRTIDQDLLGSGHYTPIKYFEKFFSDIPAMIEYLTLSLGTMDALVVYFGTMLIDMLNTAPSRYDHTQSIHPSWAVEEYTRRLFNVLTGNAEIPHVSPETMEKKRRELWHDIMKTTTTFKDTNYVVVIDAAAPNPVWLVESPQKAVAKYKVATGTAHALPVLPSVKDWLDSYGEIDSMDMVYKMTDEYHTRYPLIVRTVALDDF